MYSLEISNVSKVVKQKKILENISFTVNSGQVLGISGPNGSGKSMLLKVISGLTSYTQGTVKINEKIVGKDIEHLPETGIVIESAQFINELTGFQNLKFLAAINNKITDHEIYTVLNTLGLSDAGDVKYKNFSLGMKQRLAIAQAIMEDQAILILDEPTNALDEEGINVITNILLAERKQGKLIIVTSHDAAFLEKVSDIKLRLYEGRIV